MSKSNSYTSSKPESMTNGNREKESFFGSQDPLGVQTKEEPFFQRKLSVGQPGDKFEKEADNIADKVVSKKGIDDGPAIQRQEISSIQRLATPIEDENFATNDERMKRDRELREKPEVQTKCSHCEEEEKHAVQKKEEREDPGSTVQRKGDSPGVASDSLTGRIDSSRGKGSSLLGPTLSEMQSSFGIDFSTVSIHTDAESVAMNRELGAQAFTHGSDIYFNTGKFNPESSTGKHLLAHELTHVVQQGATADAQHTDHTGVPEESTHNPDQAPTSDRTNSHTTTHAQTSIQREVTEKIPEAKNQFYGHGAFYGAAPQLMDDKKWSRILQALMPDVYAAASAAIKKGPNSPELILQFENNPVMAAYGMYMTHQMDTKKVNGRDDRIKKMEAIEWDVFLPTKIVEDFNKATDIKDKERLAHDMVTEMIIAHGNLPQTIAENAPDWLGGARQYEDVKKTPKAGQGGVRPGAWMDLFGKALQLATDSDWEKKAKEYEDPKLHPRVDSSKDQAADKTFKNQMPFNEVISLYKGLFAKDKFSVLLDIKSRDASPAVLTALVTELNKRGVFVYGVGSFKHHELAGLGQMTQTVDGHTYSGPKEVKFFHLAGNLQEACLSHQIKPGDTVMFNAGSLISYDIPWFSKPDKADYKIKDDVVDQLREYQQRYKFHLGVYVQENDIDETAATLITNLTNKRPDIFDLGFAWGGLSGQAAKDIQPSYRHATVGIFGQDSKFVGAKDWDTGKKLPGTIARSKGSPMLSEMAYQQAEDFIRKRDFAAALNTVVSDLIVTQHLDKSKFDYNFIDIPYHGEGETELNGTYKDPGSSNYLPTGPSHMRVYPQAFSGVPLLVSTVMTQYQFVLQQQAPHKIEEILAEPFGGKSEEYFQAREVEAYLWQIEHLGDTGLLGEPGVIRELTKRLKEYYDNLGQMSPTRQATYKQRYEAAMKTSTARTPEEKELEECDKQKSPDNHCKTLYKKVMDRYGNKERDYGFNPDKDVNKKKIRNDDAPVMDSFREVYNQLDSWDVFIRRVYNEDAYNEFTSLFKLNEKRDAWLTELKQQTKGYKADFRDLTNADVKTTEKNFKKDTLEKIKKEIDTLNHQIAAWFKTRNGIPEDIDAILKKVHESGTELWREEWMTLILAVNRVLSSLWPAAKQRIDNWLADQIKQHPDIDLGGTVRNIDYVGSLATGYKGAPKQFVRFNVNKFDVDANLEAPPLAKYAMTIDHIKPDRQRIFTVAQGTSITPLIDFCSDAQQSLSNIKGYDQKDPLDVVIKAPELEEQKFSRKGTDRIYKLRGKIGESRYNTMIGEIQSAGLFQSGDKGSILKTELTADESKKLNAILKKYE